MPPIGIVRTVPEITETVYNVVMLTNNKCTGAHSFTFNNMHHDLIFDNVEPHYKVRGRVRVNVCGEGEKSKKEGRERGGGTDMKNRLPRLTQPLPS